MLTIGNLHDWVQLSAEAAIRTLSPLVNNGIRYTGNCARIGRTTRACQEIVLKALSWLSITTIKFGPILPTRWKSEEMMAGFYMR